jgi:hypothetical protein
MLQLHGHVKNGRLTFQPPNDELYMRWLSDCEDKSVTVRLSRSGPMKTNRQLGAYFGLAVTMIREAMIDKGWSICGVAPNKKMIHEILSKCCGGIGPVGEMKRLSDMTIDEAVKFFENVRDWAAAQLHIYIPDPDPNWKDKEGQS